VRPIGRPATQTLPQRWRAGEDLLDETAPVAERDAQASTVKLVPVEQPTNQLPV